VGDALGNKHAQYLKESDERVTPDVSVTNSHIVRHRGSCRSGSWEGLMGRVADVCRPTSHDDSRSYDGGDSEVKVTRLATGALRRPPRGNETQSGASSQEAACRLAAASRAATGAGSSRDGRENSTKPGLDDQSQQASRPMETPGTSTKASKTSARGRTRQSPMLAHETSPVSGASVVGMT
jgi:hypothetical protein